MDEKPEEMTSDTYTCANCGETYIKGRSDEEAKAEAGQYFPDEEDLVVICDDCFEKMRPEKNPINYALYKIEKEMNELTDRERHLLAMALLTFTYRNKQLATETSLITVKLGIQQQVDDIDVDQLLKQLDK